MTLHLSWRLGVLASWRLFSSRGGGAAAARLSAFHPAAGHLQERVYVKRSIRRFIFLALVYCLCLAPSPVWAWGREGHQIVGEIAYQRLSINAKRGVRRLLGKRTLSEVANWADTVRRERSETGPWHYVDIQVNGDGSNDKYDPVQDCPDGQCVIAKNQRLRCHSQGPNARSQ